MLTRRLALRRETLASLTPEDMASVGGGTAASAASCGPTCTTCAFEVSASYVHPTNCCATIPTFHRDAC